MPEELPSLIDRVKAAHRNYPTGITVITTTIEGEPYGLAVNAFSSVSLDPPTVLFCVNESSKTHVHLVNSDHVGINVLGRAQHDVASVFATSGGDKFSQIEWETGTMGVPVITGAAAQFEVRVDQQHKVGTHTVFICEVVDARVSDDEPLLYYRSAFIDGRHLTEHM